LTSPRSLPTSPFELSEREVTFPSNLKVVEALDNYSLVFVIFVLYVSFVFVASEASIKRPISDWKSAVEKLLVSALALLPLPVLVPLLS
jgi:hypothetical protein